MYIKGHFTSESDWYFYFINIRHSWGKEFHDILTFSERVTPIKIFAPNKGLSILPVKCNKMPTNGEKCKRLSIKVRGQAIFFSLTLFSEGLLTCIGVRLWVPVGVPWVQLKVWAVYVSFPWLSVIFLATWRVEEAALIETHPSPSTSSSDSFFSLSFKTPSPNTERKRGRAKDWREGRRWKKMEEEQRPRKEEAKNSWEEK